MSKTLSQEAGRLLDKMHATRKMMPKLTQEALDTYHATVDELLHLFKSEISDIISREQEAANVCISQKCQLTYDYTEEPYAGANHHILFNFDCIISKEDCKPASPGLIALVCQTIASELNTVFRDNEIALFAYVTVADPELE